MRTLFEFDYHDYRTDGSVCVRPSVRGIVIRQNRLAMVYSRKFDYYTFPGGGIDHGELQTETLIRELREELGLLVLPESIREYGLIKRREKGMLDDLFIQDNYFYLCDTEKQTVPSQLEGYEVEEDYELRWVSVPEILQTNLCHSHGEITGQPWIVHLFERDRVLLEKLTGERLLVRSDPTGITTIQLEYRKGVPTDLDAICELVSSAIILMKNQGIEQWDEVYPDSSVFETDIRTGTLHVVYAGEKLAAVYVLSQQCDDAYHNAEWENPEETACILHRFCVSPFFQHRGIGKTVLTWLERQAAEAGFASVRLDAFTNNPYAQKLYRHNGYEIRGGADWRKGRFDLMEKKL